MCDVEGCKYPIGRIIITETSLTISNPYELCQVLQDQISEPPELPSGQE